MNRIFEHLTKQLSLAVLLLLIGTANAQTGPLVGTVKPTEAYFLYRPGETQKTLRLSVLGSSNQVVATSESVSLAENDYVAKFHATGLQPATSYQYRVEDITSGSAVQILGPADGLKFKTALPSGARGVITAAFASCADSSSEPVWQRMQLLQVDQVFLMGDTPYIDSSDLTTIRTKHRNFLSSPFMIPLVRGTPTVGVWDDHDFGINASNGLSFEAGKPNTRKGFVEYRAHDQFGTGTEGVYHKVDLGVMEVFLLDPRWFSQTEPSPVSPSQKTGFGAAQWQWLRAGLKASHAPFKVLAFGEVWQDKKNAETDDLFTYYYERDALFDYIRTEKIPGVVLLGGDIHISRHLVHRQRVGYDLHDFVTSPAHVSTIPSLDVPHPDLEWSSQLGNQFLTVTADTRTNPAKLMVRFMLGNGTMQREVVIPYTEMTPKEGNTLGLGLRAWWPFDGDLNNRSVIGARVNATAINNATLLADGGLRGGAVEFSRAMQQYLLVQRSPLDDNGAANTVSLWCNPATLPAHATADRAFLIETTLGGAVSGDAAYSISIGFRADTTSADKVNLELYTNTLQPAASTTTSPTALPQGPFPTSLDRSLFTNRWAHVAVTFDSTNLKLYVDGNLVATHVLPIPGPMAEVGGLVIGGHRLGTGRNYDGKLDEIAIWSRALSAEEITTLFHGGAPEALPTLISASDTDGDTMEDWWESLHGLNPNDSADALADTDNDNVPAYLERKSGTDPQSDDSVLYNYLKQLTAPNSPPQKLIFRHPEGYVKFHLTLEDSSNLFDWDPSANATGSLGNDPSFLFTVPSPLSEPARFYRFKATP